MTTITMDRKLCTRECRRVPATLYYVIRLTLVALQAHCPAVQPLSHWYVMQEGNIAALPSSLCRKSSGQSTDLTGSQGMMYVLAGHTLTLCLALLAERARTL